MKIQIITSFLIAIVSMGSFAQEALKDNGFNIQELCPPEKCRYISWDTPTYFPFEDDKEWQINNLEIGIKKSGKMLISGDMNIVGEDTAAIVQLEFVFVDANDKNLASFKTDKFEFFNESGNAEPIVFSGEVPADVSSQVSYVLTEIRHSQRVPYYEISSSCFLPCKNFRLKEELKAFKKAK